MRARKHSGSAALEVLLLIPFILLIWVLLTVMGYSSLRHRISQAALHIGAFEYADQLALSNSNQAQSSVAGLLNQTQFDGESTKTTFTAKEGTDPVRIDTSELDSNDDPGGDGFGQLMGLIGKASNRSTVTVTVPRTSPYPDYIASQPISKSLVVSSNTWTYCEMKDGIFGGGDSSTDFGDLALIVGKSALWPFGGDPGKDRCP